jgi:hypothetical protein
MARILTANRAGLTTEEDRTYREHDFGEVCGHAETGWLQISLQKQPKGRGARQAAAHPLTCIFPVNAGERVSFSHVMRYGFFTGHVASG